MASSLILITCSNPNISVTIAGLTTPDYTTCQFSSGGGSTTALISKAVIDVGYFQDPITCIKQGSVTEMCGIQPYYAGVIVYNWLQSTIPNNYQQQSGPIGNLFINTGDIWPLRANVTIRKPNNRGTRSEYSAPTTSYSMEITGDEIDAASDISTPTVATVAFPLIPLSLMSDQINFWPDYFPTAEGEVNSAIITFSLEFLSMGGDVVTSDSFQLQLDFCYGCLNPRLYNECIINSKCTIDTNICWPGIQQEAQCTCTST
jgi:hypothetical protein